MFGDGKIEVINEDGELYINMWEMVQHLVTSSYVMEKSEGENLIADTLRLIALTLCDLAMYELGMDKLDQFNDVESILEYWEAQR